ncbi:MAG: hypothetical protein IPQ07_01510 [Myxococcales bacterium]|nr:hypothetical protein [Myxococcales bacterium]
MMAGFHWLSSAAVTQLATLKDDIKAKDEPPWVEQLAEAALEVALHAGLAGAAEYVAGRLFDHAADNAVNEGKHEFVKALFEEGIGEGISTCRSTARKPTKDGVLTRFIGAQAAGIQATHQKNQTEWINKGRHSVTTVDEASALALACSPANVEAAAMKRYDASRDAWISHLAQSKYGAVPRGDGARSKTGRAQHCDQHEYPGISEIEPTGRRRILYQVVRLTSGMPCSVMPRGSWRS